MIKVDSGLEERISQGDILRNVEMIKAVYEREGKLIVDRVSFPYVIVITQDCDLQQDKTFRSDGKNTHDKLLFSTILIPLYNAEHFFQGEHLSHLELTMAKINRKKTPGKNIEQNTNPRYHFLRFDEDTPIPDSVMDFKHYFTIGIDQIYEIKDTNRICRVSELYREQISHRFANYLSRIGLPNV